MESNHQDIEPTRTDAASAISRWDDEGGAQVPPNLSAQRHAALTERERHILECLGAALVKEWTDLPTAVQRALFRRATASDHDDPVQLKVLIARFLHDHKDAPAAPEASARS
ncbi:hypothetical protein [Xanthobacter oligotrophicus]|uniref:hypothetical protein n=1 Tax=Xanthobacter oligotrophicus TaxID=2607286 RepID=UPI0011F34563|nr:hypothetical protein [Xanthobacter oligotrophicus]MCG5236352.1 hypothetical protein [Xanthobacter oligotrophicus]